LTGSVKNLDDGSVLAIAEGQEEKLRQWLAKLKKGPVLARVERVEERWLEVSGEFKDFKILYK